MPLRRRMIRLLQKMREREGKSRMTMLEQVTEAFVARSREILGENLVGVYLHGSAVMGCFNPQKSDIDLLVVVDDAPCAEDKLRYMDMVVELNAIAPAKGIEFSMVRRAVCSPLLYPTPFELHFSIAHLAWYNASPRDYVLKMNGTDRDLAAHATVLYHRGRCLWGEEIRSVFAPVDEKAYWDSIVSDVERAEEDILDAPVYTTLNLCRVLAYKKEKLILSKREGGEWGMVNVPKRYGALIQSALGDYASGTQSTPDEPLAREYAGYMLRSILAV